MKPVEIEPGKHLINREVNWLVSLQQLPYMLSHQQTSQHSTLVSQLKETLFWLILTLILTTKGLVLTGKRRRNLFNSLMSLMLNI